VVESIIEVAIGGLGLGSIYAMVAIGFVIVYKTSGVLNFAHGTLGAAGGLIMASLVTDGGLGIDPLAGANPLTRYADSLGGWAANLVVAMALAAIIGMVVERVAVRPLLGRSQFTVTVATIGISIALGMAVNRAPIPRDLRVPWTNRTWQVGEATIAVSSLAAIALGIASALALALFNRSRWGLAVRAVASDHEAAAIQGIDPRRVHTLTWALAAALATVAAVAFSFSPLGQGAIVTGQTPALFFRALPVIALGGWDSYMGAYLGGLAIGLLQIAAGRYLSSHSELLGPGYSAVLPYLLMIAVLLIRPAGILGQPAVRRV
jgi:branched-chain amino acid transport system permease protein